MTDLSDLFDVKALDVAIAEGLVSARKHPAAALTILNYTERCQYEAGLWSPVTLQCRGLIHDDLGKVVARPFPKFFNYGQAEAPTIDGLVEVTDKLDGSLGITYPMGDGWALATRGSFVGEQAVHGTEVLRSRYPAFRPPAGWTVLFEIIYPSNRIVLDYGAVDDLVLLGIVEIATGRSLGPSALGNVEWTGPRAQVFQYETLADALAAEPRLNAEGLVVKCLTTGERVKLKQEDYVRLHKIISGLSERAIWEHLAAGRELDEMLTIVPDEFHGWVREVATRLQATADVRVAEIESAYSTILAALPDGFARKDYALAAKDHSDARYLFARHDGKDYRLKLWDELKPEPFLSPRTIAPDAA